MASTNKKIMSKEIILVVFYFAILIYSIILHEVSHGIVALWLGDKTAKYAGRLTANPLKHIDLWMTIIVPFLMLVLSGGRFAFGGAKPVPYNPYNLKNQKWGPTIIALAGPASNILIALVAAVSAGLISLPYSIKLDIINNFNDWSAASTLITNSLPAVFFELLIIIIFWNVLLAFFNLIPIPPLDGSKIIYSIFNVSTRTMIFMEQFGFVILLGFVWFFGNVLSLFLYFFLNIFLRITL